MVVVESTPEMVAGVYATLAKNQGVVRRRLGRSLTLADKVLLGHLADPESQEFVPGQSQLALRPDRVALQDVLGQTVMLNFSQTRRASTAVPTTVHCDHLIQARVDGAPDLLESVAENDEVYSYLRSASAKFGVGFWGPGAGIIHQVIIENYAFPGALIIGTDSHTPNAGGLGACAVGVGGADAVEVMAGLNWELLFPRHIGVRLTGELNGWTAPKDVILYLAGALTVTGGTNSIIEYFGPGTRSISCTGKATITNMGAELGATTSMFPYDERMEAYLRATRRGEIADLANDNQALLIPDEDVEANPEKYFDTVVEIDLSKLEPHVDIIVTPQKNIDTSKSFYKVEFNNTPSTLLGQSGEGWNYIQHLLDQAAVLFAFEQVGGSQAALDMAKAYSLERFAFGRQIGSYQAIKHKLADMYIAITLAKSNCYYGAWALSSESSELSLAAATARVSATKAFQLCSKENIQTHGGNGFTWEYDCHLFYKRSKVLSVLLGSEATWKEKLVQNLEKTNTLVKE